MPARALTRDVAQRRGTLISHEMKGDEARALLKTEVKVFGSANCWVSDQLFTGNLY